MTWFLPPSTGAGLTISCLRIKRTNNMSPKMLLTKDSWFFPPLSGRGRLEPRNQEPCLSDAPQLVPD